MQLTTRGAAVGLPIEVRQKPSLSIFTLGLSLLHLLLVETFGQVPQRGSLLQISMGEGPTRVPILLGP